MGKRNIRPQIPLGPFLGEFALSLVVLGMSGLAPLDRESQTSWAWVWVGCRGV